MLPVGVLVPTESYSGYRIVYDLGMRDEVGIERPKPFRPALNGYFGLKCWSSKGYFGLKCWSSKGPYRVDFVGAIGHK